MVYLCQIEDVCMRWRNATNTDMYKTQKEGCGRALKRLEKATFSGPRKVNDAHKHICIYTFVYVCAYVYTYIYILDVLDVFYLYELCVYISMYLYTVNICRYL